MARTFLVPDASKERASGLVADAQAIQRAQNRSTTSAALAQAVIAAKRLRRSVGYALADLHKQKAAAEAAEQETL